MSRSLLGLAPSSMHSTRRRSLRADATTAHPASARIIIPIITARSCSIPTATISKPFAIRRNSAASELRFPVRCAGTSARWHRYRHGASGNQPTEQAMSQAVSNDNARDLDRAWELMKKIGFAMLVTQDGGKLRARPMAAYVERE